MFLCPGSKKLTYAHSQGKLLDLPHINKVAPAFQNVPLPTISGNTVKSQALAACAKPLTQVFHTEKQSLKFPVQSHVFKGSQFKL